MSRLWECTVSIMWEKSGGLKSISKNNRHAFYTKVQPREVDEFTIMHELI